MAGAAEPRRSMMVLAHHAKKLEDHFLVSAFMPLGGPRWTQDFASARIREAHASGLRGGIPVVLPHPAPAWEGQDATLSVVVRQSGGFQASNSKHVDIPKLAAEPDEWVYVRANHKDLLHTGQLEADWFSEKIQQFLPVFEPDFACFDTDVAVAKHFGEHPADNVWPLAYYGPEQVAALGRERVLNAPAWELKEDKRGGVWVQATQNPFTAQSVDLKQLAAHLGVKARK